MSNTTAPLITVAHYEKAIKALSTFSAALPQIYAGYKGAASNTSQAFTEAADAKYGKLAFDAHCRGHLSMEIAADHLAAFIDIATPPVSTLAPFTCIRGLMESAAIAIWFLDPSLDVSTRVGRCFAFRYEGFVQQLKLSAGAHTTKIEQRLVQVEHEAIALGFPKLEANGKRTGIGVHWPGITELTKLTLDRQVDYRMLSSVAHGHHWAAHSIGFRVMDPSAPDGQLTLQKFAHPESFAYLAMVGMLSMSQTLVPLWRLFGWNSQELGELLQKAFDDMGLKDKMRHWR